MWELQLSEEMQSDDGLREFVERLDVVPQLAEA